MFDYLYYKLYRASLKSSLKDIPEVFATILFGGLISINVLVLYLLSVKLNLLPYLVTDTKQGGWLVVIGIILAFAYFRESKRLAILKKYSGESRKERIKGNTIVAIYVGLSFLSIFALGLFKPGIL